MLAPAQNFSTSRPTTESGFYLDPVEIAYRKKKMRSDVWLFIKWVCNHGERAVERFHRPLAYLYAGDAVRLAACLEKYQSEVVDQIKRQLVRRHINWKTKQGIEQLRAQLRFINVRISRAHGKTTIATDVLLWIATHNPDIDIGIASKSDGAAWEMCEMIGNIMRTDEYAIYYPERLFRLVSGKGFNLDSDITNQWIRMNGRTKTMQKTIEGRGINSQWYLRHYDIIYCDDLCSTEAKQGIATVQDAKRFIASMSGLSIANQWGGTREIFNGTITGPKDDNAILSADDSMGRPSLHMSIRIPIWLKTVTANIRNLMENGIPTLPEWNRVEDIIRMRDKELKNPDYGPVSWLQNFELTANEAGTMSFTNEMIDRAKFTWVVKNVRDLKTGKEVSRRWIRRYLWLKDDKGNLLPLPNEKLKPIPTGTCKCYQRCKLGDHDYVEFNPELLPRVLGVDQAFATAGNPDQWSVANISRDPYNYFYQLRGKKGIGYSTMIPAIKIVAMLYGGNRNYPKKVGIESNMVQSNTAYWIQQTEEVFGILSHRVVPVSPGKIQKTMRIFSNVFAMMETGMLLIDPDDVDFIQEALMYDPSADDPQDDILDSVSIAMVLHTIHATDVEEDRKAIVEADRQYMRDVDPMTGIDVSSNFMDDVMDEMWN